MKISIIIPILNEEAIIEETLNRLKRLIGDYEVIVVDGGSSDNTPDIAMRLADIFLTSEMGRAIQMNRGAKAGGGDVLLFLHADTAISDDSFQRIQTALSERSVIGGRFDIEFDNNSLIYRFLAWTINLRSRISKISTGDQAIFIRRDVFFKMGGYPEISLMEDVEFTKRMKRRGKISCIRKKVITSARRWEKMGLIRTVFLMHYLRLLYFLGVKPEILKRCYIDLRE
ncbi:MAG: TIGR04283 family arsenosugar biosynthesis glycosyltransferase [Nitrospirota bacterium]